MSSPVKEKRRYNHPTSEDRRSHHERHPGGWIPKGTIKGMSGIKKELPNLEFYDHHER